MAKRERVAVEMRCRVIKVRTHMEGVMVGLVLAVFLTSDLLLRAGNVETNPGPGTTDGKDSSRTVQTRLTTAGARAGSSSTERRQSVSSQPSEPTLADLMAKLMSMESSMNGKLDQVREDFQLVREEVGNLQKEVQDLKEKVAVLEKENEGMKKVNEELFKRVDQVEKHADDLESRSRRNNILFYGLKREERETPRDLEIRVKDVLNDKMGLADNIEMDRVHRLGTKDDSPIIARCTFYKDKVTILKAKQKLKGTRIFIGEDFSKGVRGIRKLLQPFLKEMRQAGKKATMVHDHIVVDGKRFFLAADGQNVVEDK